MGSDLNNRGFVHIETRRQFAFELLQFGGEFRGAGQQFPHPHERPDDTERDSAEMVMPQGMAP